MKKTTTTWEEIGQADLREQGYFSHPNPAICSAVATAAESAGMRVGRMRVWYPRSAWAEYRIDKLH